MNGRPLSAGLSLPPLPEAPVRKRWADGRRGPAVCQTPLSGATLGPGENPSTTALYPAPCMVWLVCLPPEPLPDVSHFLGGWGTYKFTCHQLPQLLLSVPWQGPGSVCAVESKLKSGAACSGACFAGCGARGLVVTQHTGN